MKAQALHRRYGHTAQSAKLAIVADIRVGDQIRFGHPGSLSYTVVWLGEPHVKIGEQMRRGTGISRPRARGLRVKMKVQPMLLNTGTETIELSPKMSTSVWIAR